MMDFTVSLTFSLASLCFYYFVEAERAPSTRNVLSELDPRGRTTVHSNDLKAVITTCEVDRSIPSKYRQMYADLRTKTPRVKRSSVERRLIETYVVIDNTLFSGAYIKGNKSRALKYAEEVVDTVDKWFTDELNTRVTMIGLELWDKEDKINGSADPKTLLESFLQYSMSSIKSVRLDLVVLVSGTDFTGTLAGMAYIGVFCGPLSGTVIQHFSTSLHPELKTAVTLAHEIGHLLGLVHDTPSCACADPSGKCIMDPDITTNPTIFSSCSKSDLQSLLQGGVGHCLHDLPATVYGGPVCGNGIREMGEVCDCGDVVGCTRDPCCMYPCKLRLKALCSSGGCCSGCQILPRGTVCRGFQNDCDLEEVCDGQQSEVAGYIDISKTVIIKERFKSEHLRCPTDHYKRDMLVCGSANQPGYCYGGKCRSNHIQCLNMWGNGSRLGDILCYGDNTKGDKAGNCGSIDTSQKKPCQLSDIMCGTLQCETTAKFPSFGGSQIINLKTKSFPNGTSISCKAANIDLGPDIPDPGLVEDGSPCHDLDKGTDGVCLAQECIDMKTFSVKHCPQGLIGIECSGNGICNEEGQCVCSHGYGGTDCSHRQIQCNVSNVPEHVVKVTVWDLFNASDVMIYRCEQGFTLVSGNLVRTCLPTGNLSGSEPKCERDGIEPKEETEFPLWAIIVAGVCGPVTLTCVVVIFCLACRYKKKNRTKDFPMQTYVVPTKPESAKALKNTAGNRRGPGPLKPSNRVWNLSVKQSP